MADTNTWQCRKCGAPNPVLHDACFICKAEKTPKETKGPISPQSSQPPQDQLLEDLTQLPSIPPNAALPVVSSGHSLLWLIPVALIVLLLMTMVVDEFVVLLLGTFVVFPCIVVALVISSSANSRRALEQAIDSVVGFSPTQKKLTSDRSAIAIDEHSQKVCFAEKQGWGQPVVVDVVGYADIVKGEVVDRTETISLNKTATHISVVYLRTVVRNTARPAHLTFFGADVDGAEYWHGLLSVVANQAGLAARLSPADELEKLAGLKDSGILGEDDWVRAKELYLGKPTSQREESVRLLQDMHNLMKRGALSESEFNNKKWEILSRKDI